jgi:5-methylcytosine-specific restriction endonuclease McrA
MSGSRRQVLHRAAVARDGRCRLSLPGCTGLATQAHHLRPVADGGATVLANLVGACASCHAKVTAAARRGMRRWAPNEIAPVATQAFGA